MVQDGDIVAIFHSIHRVMKAEKLLKQQRVEMLLIPVPRQLTSDCGLAIRLHPDNWQRASEVLAEAELLPAELYLRRDDSYRPLEAL